MRNNSKNIILERSANMFFNYGIQNISMDDIAKKCGVSKKTIYKYFENKDDLVHQVIGVQLKELKEEIFKNKQVSENALKELILFFDYIKELSFKISASFGKELKKYYPTIFLEVIKHKNTIITHFLIENISKGKEEGFYKMDINTEEFCESFNDISKIIFLDGFVNPEINQNVLKFLNSLFLHRLVSVKGLKTLNELTKNKTI
ncbi:TetR/AcrR family transcriptional regulator [Maribacter sp. PR1]|uniref:TetR/AcrR family transcriptional regulator n=1 Tax=Maribacter cobaltidurans TaxID=1178778 RepID=A0ABU7IWU5_9FLAO|nr:MULTISPECIES: TetR/AcrR family transcriptional regulator [Maribacter]MCR9264342.1 TetR/AcrR family transcriptional regulator [Flavobacteriaceae bacterium]MDC6389918.1 TetR/AcrR family transcriptional regulator [Maribacter sp. PR1]MEE1977308.1 TetR/AcrR family transcriptional regulator [Maribacter cobaltidurans]|tara:strand:- start:6708 stop:7319 length:612 start_codon:yes stop_codon:yes gene_type:complete